MNTSLTSLTISPVSGCSVVKRSISSLNESQQEYLDEDIIIAIPESMRNGLFRFIEKMVDKKVEI